MHLEIKKRYKHWKYHNTFLLLLSFLAIYIFSRTEDYVNFLDLISGLGFFGVFLIGMFFVSTFTVVPATVVLVSLASSTSLFELAVYAGAGGVVGDYFILRVLKGGVFEELKPEFLKISSYFGNIIHTPFFSWLMPVLGAVVIASPLPDEIGISLLGISKLKYWQFILVSFLLNTIGLYLLFIAFT